MKVDWSAFNKSGRPRTIRFEGWGLVMKDGQLAIDVNGKLFVVSSRAKALGAKCSPGERPVRVEVTVKVLGGKK